jgi:ribosome-associated heat shock protein Hsp15
MNLEPVRIDKWLWAARLVKTRALAVDAIRGGRVKLNGVPAKPSKDVRPGDRIEFSAGVIRLEAVIRGTAERRLSWAAWPRGYNYLKTRISMLSCWIFRCRIAVAWRH